MNKRLFDNNGGETLNADGNYMAELVNYHLNPLVEKAVESGISLRDLTSVVIDEITVLTAEARLRKGLAERRAEREAIRLNKDNSNSY